MERRPGFFAGDLVLLKCHLHDDAFDGESANQQTTGTSAAGGVVVAHA